MKKLVPILALLALAAVVFGVAGCSNEATAPDADKNLSSQEMPATDRHHPGERVVIANRASGTISVIDARTDEVVGTYALPSSDGEPAPEPMYVVSVPRYGRVFVGDRANDRVAVFNARTFDVEGMVPAGAGVFHMWADARGRQLWVNNDVDNTTTVIDLRTLTVRATVPTPADLVAMGGHPHDVILGPLGVLAYVTVLGVSGDNDYVVQFSTHSLQETGRAPVGKDAHLSLTRRNRWLYVPCQNTNQVIVLNRFTMQPRTDIAVPGAHGAGMTHSGRWFYTTNISGGGTDAISTINTRTNTLAGDPVDSPYPVPHNLALTRNDRKLYLTHSGGTSDKVTVYRIHGHDPTPQYVGEVTVGLNPFGLDVVP